MKSLSDISAIYIVMQTNMSLHWIRETHFLFLARNAIFLPFWMPPSVCIYYAQYRLGGWVGGCGCREKIYQHPHPPTPLPLPTYHTLKTESSSISNPDYFTTYDIVCFNVIYFAINLFRSVYVMSIHFFFLLFWSYNKEKSFIHRRATKTVPMVEA